VNVTHAAYTPIRYGPSAVQKMLATTLRLSDETAQSFEEDWISRRAAILTVCLEMVRARGAPVWYLKRGARVTILSCRDGWRGVRHSDS
jgi:hypothetical protein